MYLSMTSASGYFLVVIWVQNKKSPQKPQKVNLWPASADTLIEREELIFPISSLVCGTQKCTDGLTHTLVYPLCCCTHKHRHTVHCTNMAIENIRNVILLNFIQLFNVLVMLRWQDSEAPLVFFLASRSWQSGRALTFSAPLQKSVIMLLGFCQKLDNNYFDKIGISRISFVRAGLVIGQLINLQSWGKCSRLFKYVFHKWLNYKICDICIGWYIR